MTSSNEPATHPPRWGATLGDRQYIVYARDSLEADERIRAHVGDAYAEFDIQPLPALLDERPVMQEGRITHVTEPTQ